MKPLSLLAFSIIFFVGISCREEKADPTRSYYMGFTPFPYDISLEAVDETYANISSKADIINHHFDNGVPWTEALSGAEFSDNIMNDWNFRRGLTPTSHKVYLSLAALKPTRDGLALYRGDADDMPLSAPWDSYTFNHADVKTAYLNYCKRAIEFFQPDYFNMSIEANLLHFLAPSQWASYVNFHQYIYENLKALYPDLPVFCSVTGAHLLEGYFDNNDVSQQRLAVLGVLEYSDLYALSFYPYMSKYLGNPYPENSFEELFKLSDKPLAIAETGYPAQTFNLTVDNVSVTINADETKQNNFMLDLLESCNKRGAVFVIQFTVRDYDQLWTYLGGKEDITIAWRDTGLQDEQGHQRTSMATWMNHFSRPISQP